MPGSFVDTNILIYLAGDDDRRADRVEAVLAEGVTISVQVLNEATNVLRRKRKLDWSAVHRFLDGLHILVAAIEPVTLLTHEEGCRIAERYRLSIYDAMIVAAARIAGCDRLWSEDMQDGLLIDGVLRIENPFAAQ